MLRMQIRRWRSLNVIESGETKKKTGVTDKKKKKMQGKIKRISAFVTLERKKTSRRSISLEKRKQNVVVIAT